MKNGTYKKLRVLEKTGRALNDNGINWAVGGSLLLYLKGMVDDFNDIDIMVMESDIDLFMDIMDSISTLKPKKENTGYRTRYFLQYEYSGVDIDAMCMLAIIRDGKCHELPLEKDQIEEVYDLNGVKIPLQSVRHWRRIYSLMGREEKVRIIERHLSLRH